MRQAIAGVLAAGALVLGTGHGRADVILSLSSDKPLGSLTVGQTVNFKVNVQLTNHEDLDILTTKVLFTTGFFKLSTPVAPPLGSGGVVPDPADDFVGTANVNTSPVGFDDADGSFFLPIGGDITTSGVFFTFRATALKAGSATISFDPLSTSADDVTNGALTPTLPPSQVARITVPEPASLLLWGVAAAGGLLGRRRRPRRQPAMT